jgi:hypothetical protein
MNRPPVPIWVEMTGPPFMVVGCLFTAWLLVYRLDWLNRSWQRFGLRLSPTGARLIACAYLVGAAYWTVELARMVATHIP